MQNRQQLDNVAVQMSRTSGSEGRPFRLRITDQASGVRIIEVTLNEEAFADLMSTATAYGVGDAATAAQYERVGMDRTVTTERVPRELVEGVYDREEARALIEPWAEERRAAIGAQAVRIDSSRDGWSITLSTYTPADA